MLTVIITVRYALAGCRNYKIKINREEEDTSDVCDTVGEQINSYHRKMLCYYRTVDSFN